MLRCSIKVIKNLLYVTLHVMCYMSHQVMLTLYLINQSHQSVKSEEKAANDEKIPLHIVISLAWK